MKVTALAGGVGGAKLLVGLQRALPDPRLLTAIVNTGDDAEIYGLRISPDIDIVTYWLAGIADTDKGWGIRGDSFSVVEALRGLGVDAWFRLGDRDLATCIHRTMLLRDGMTLSGVTDQIRRSLDVAARIIPMSDDRVATRIATSDGRVLEFQEYFVKERTRPDVARLCFEGADAAKPASGVLDAIRHADAVVICPSNPLLSIGPILALPGVRDALGDHPRVIAVTPLVRGSALKGPADRVMASLGHEPTAAGVARLYSGVCDRFVLDASDVELCDAVSDAGIEPVALPTIMRDHDDATRLAEQLLLA